MTKIPTGMPPPPPVNPPWKKDEVQAPGIKPVTAPPTKGISAGTIQEALARMDAAAIAARLAILGVEAKRRELSMAEIVEKAMLEAGIIDPQGAMEEANRKLQKEIEETLEEIKANKELMEEAQAWQELGELLEHKLSQEQIKEIFDTISRQLS